MLIVRYDLYDEDDVDELIGMGFDPAAMLEDGLDTVEMVELSVEDVGADLRKLIDELWEIERGRRNN